MELKDLKVNNRVEFRNGERYKVVYNGKISLFVEENEKNYFEAEGNYNQDMTNKFDSQYDIVKVETLTKTIELNQHCKKRKTMDDLLDDMMKYVDDLDLDDEELINEREKVRKLYKQLKNKKSINKVDKIKDKIKDELNVEIKNFNIKSEDGCTTIEIDGFGKLTEKDRKRMSEIITDELK